MKTADSDLKANRNIYPDAVTCDIWINISVKTSAKICIMPFDVHGYKVVSISDF